MFHAASRREARIALTEVIGYLEEVSANINSSHHAELAGLAVEAGAPQQLADLAACYVSGYWPMWLDSDETPIARTAMAWFEERWCGPPWGFEPHVIAGVSAFGHFGQGMAMAALDRLARRVGVDDVHVDMNGGVVAYDA